jgi:FtsP/CotA-like multicopper oxidase with cupredoxin domain
MAKIEYWLQIENHPWDVMPHGIDRMSGHVIPRDANGLCQPLPTDALLIRRHNANWQKPDDRPINPWDLNEPDPTQTQGTIPGATIEARVGDELIIHFRNADMRPGLSDAERTHSLHLHGVQHTGLYDGTYPFSPPDPAQGGKQGDRVAPGDSFDYRFSCPHAANAGTWPYHDHSIYHHESVSLGAFGTLVIRAATESGAEQPKGRVRQSGDSSTQFATVPRPPIRGEHIIFFHELMNVGECMNGRRILGNTPTVLARPDASIRFRILNLSGCCQTFHIHGHRWQNAGDWTDAQLVGAGMTLTFDMLEQSVENGGGLGEWLVMSHSEHMTHMAHDAHHSSMGMPIAGARADHSSHEMAHHPHALVGSLLVTEGGALTLPIAIETGREENRGGTHHHG